MNPYIKPILFSFLTTAAGVFAQNPPEIDVTTDLVPLGIARDNLKGDGETDDAPALQALADYLADRGGKVIFPPGRYLLGSTVNFQQEADQALELVGVNAVVVSSGFAARQLLFFRSRITVRQSLTQPAGAFDTVLHVSDTEAFNVGDLVGVRSRRSNEPPANLGDNSGGVEHLATVASVDGEAGTITLAAKLPWHQKATNNIFGTVSKYDYYPLTLRGFRFEFTEPRPDHIAEFSNMRNLTLEDIEVNYVGNRPEPTGNGFRFQGVHSLYCKNVDFHRVQYCLYQIDGNSDHTYIGCDGYRTRHTYVLSDSTNTVIRDSQGYGCVGHLDTHRGVNHLLVHGVRSDHDQGGFRNIAAVSVIRDSIFTGFARTAVSISGGEARIQPNTYVLGIVGEGLDEVAIDDTLVLDENITAAVVSIMERGKDAITVIAYQLRGSGYDDGGPSTSIGSRTSSGGWPVTVPNKKNVSGRVVFSDYVQTHLGRSVIDNCYFDASSATRPAIVINGGFSAEIRNSTITNPDVGISVGGAVVAWNDSIRIENVRILQPRTAAFQLNNWQGVDLVHCEVIGTRRNGVGIAIQNGHGNIARLVDCRFSGLETAVDFKGTLKATGLTIEDSMTGLVLHGNSNYQLRNFRNTADHPVRRENFRGHLAAFPTLDDYDPDNFFAVEGAAYFDPSRERFWFLTPDGWRNEEGDASAR